MKKVVIIEGVRTPIGRHGGAFRNLPAQDLAAITMRAVSYTHLTLPTICSV